MICNVQGFDSTVLIYERNQNGSSKFLCKYMGKSIVGSGNHVTK